MSKQSYLRGHGTRVTPQSEPMREDQVENSAGGFAWEVSCWTRLRRFLILGSEGGSYYATEYDLTKSNIDALKECLLKDGPRTVNLILQVSQEGQAPKNEIAIFALAYCAGNGDENTRAIALEALPGVCRTGTHMFQFLTFVQEQRGWGPALKKAVSKWYLGKDPDKLAYQLVKYRQREGWTHRDALRKAKPGSRQRSNVHHCKPGPEHDALFAWVVGKGVVEPAPLVIKGYVRAQEPINADAIPEIIRQYKIPREALPSEALTRPDVWEALLETDMPMTALIRNLGNMTRIGLLTPTSAAMAQVVKQIGDVERIHKARVHPVTILYALMTYQAGRGFRGSNTWTPIPQVIDALDAAFYTAFDNVEPTGKSHLLAIDISPSMGGRGESMLTPREGAAAMAMLAARTESRYECVAFAGSGGWTDQTGIQPFPISPRQRLDDVVRECERISRSYSRTNCALPMLYAIENRREIDVFVIYTDSETWYGNIHPAQALRQYRETTGINAKLIVVGMVPNKFSIADPNDAGMLDVVGFDTSAPQIMAEFTLGRV